MNRTIFIISILFFYTLSALTFSEMRFSPSSAFAFSFTEEIDANQEALSQIMQSVLEKQEQILVDIEIERQLYAESLRSDIVEFGIMRQHIYNDFKHLYPIYWFNRDEPTELALMSEQVNRFIFQINELYIPLTNVHDRIHLRLEQLRNLIDSLSALDNPTVQSMLERAENLNIQYDRMDTDLNRVSAVTDSVLEDLSTTYKELEDRMPRFWLDFYINQKLDLLARLNVVVQPNFFLDLVDNAKLTIIREMPTTKSEWSAVFNNAFFLIIGFTALLIIAYKISYLLPQSMQEAWKKALTTSIPWIMLGITLQIVSWHGGNRYQLVNAIGTFMLCFGQIRLFWQTLCLKREEEHSKKSPFSMVLPILIISFILLSMTSFPILTSVGWIIFLIAFLVIMRKTKPTTFPLVRFLLRSFYLVIGIGLFLALTTGFVHLSFFIVLLYMCIMIGVHQSATCLYFTSLLNEHLPQNGFPALISGFLLSISVPVI